VPAGKVVGELATEVKKYLNASAPVGVHLADQLIIPFAMAGGGMFRTTGISAHTSTNIGVVESFLDVEISTEREEQGGTAVAVRRLPGW
jgi:RNA 3'-terminal phosphate cyclase (ATP)